MIPLAPVTDRAYLERFAQAGAREFYLGFHDPAWHERFGDAVDLNRMTGFGRKANPYTFSQVLDIVRAARELRCGTYVTFNANAYSRRQLDYLFGYFERLADAGAAGVIVSVPEAVGAAADCGLEVAASTMCGVYNADIARAYGGLGCTRVIVPRDMTLAEIEALACEVPGLQLEAFLMRNGCIFSDGLCLGRHFAHGNALCWDVRHARCEHLVAPKRDQPFLREGLQRNARAYAQLHQSTCGLCAIWRLLRAGVMAAKIVGRSDDPQRVLQDIRAVARNVAIAQQCATEEDYLARMEVPSARASCCEDGLSCYYPEVRFAAAGDESRKDVTPV